MAVVVEQTIPFDSKTLDIENTARWNKLFPLIRPSVKAIRTNKGQNILVDQNLAKSHLIHIAAVGGAGNFSSKLLDDRNIAAIVTEQAGAGILTTEDIAHTLRSAGLAEKQGLVVVKAGKQRRVQTLNPELAEIETDGELEMDHVLHLLANATDSCRTAMIQVAELLKIFAKSSSSSHSKFHTEKAEGNPAILHASGSSGFEKAKHAVERDLKHAMKAQTAQTQKSVYSVHFSDVNGLSRLENYILAKAIAEHLESQNVPFHLSHSSVLNHREQARGFAISICPVPEHFLKPQARPKQHDNSEFPTGKTDDDDNRSSVAPDQPLASAESKINFDDKALRARIEGGCNAVIAAEPTITEYDTIVGDGDCGYTLRDGAKQVLSFIADKDLTRLPRVLAALVADLEVNMGGTSGALYCIYLTALATSLASQSTVPAALRAALAEMLKYTRARVGDRTMMDALIPFVETLEKTGDARSAVDEARAGVEGTKRMQATLGRSTYLDDSATQGVPDPGAYGLLVLLEGMANA